jgi:hypothetical protein
MLASLSIFLEFNLPNATTWFYFAFLLATALFFKFGRLLSVRNADVVMVFLLVPGLLVVQAARPQPVPAPQLPAVQVAGLVAGQCNVAQPVQAVAMLHVFGQQSHSWLEARRWLWFGYLWILCGTGYFFARCLFDLALVQRPALAPNLNFGGLAWLALALFICLVAVAFRQAERHTQAPTRTPEGLQSASTPVGTESVPLALAKKWFEPPPWSLALAAVVCHLAVVLGLILVGGRHFSDWAAGMAAATFYLLLPYTGLFVGQLHHVAPMALLVWAFVAFRYPAIAGALMGVASATTFAPALLLPLWLSFYRGRGMGRFLLAFLLIGGVCLAGVGLVLWLNGELDSTLRQTRNDAAWQAWKVPTQESFWTGVHWAYRIPVFIAYLVFVLTTAFWPSPKNLGQVIALSAAILIGIQFWYGDQGGVYVLWYVPLLLLLVFRPNLQDRLPDLVPPGEGWIRRLARFLYHKAKAFLAREEPALRE